MNSEQQLNIASASYDAAKNRLSGIIGLPFANSCRGIETPSELTAEITVLQSALPELEARMNAAYDAHLAANGLTR